MRITERFDYEEIQGFKFGYSPIGKPSLFAIIYYVDGLLIDTGQRSMQKAILEKTSDLPVQQMLITHHHEDHSGNIRELRDQFNCKAYASEKCCELMKDPPSISFAQYMVWSSRPACHDLTPISGSIQTENYEFQLIPIPGHAEDMVALYEPERRWLFSADLFINGYISYFLKNESIVDQINSIKRILELDFKVLLCSHNPRIHDGREKLQEKLNYLEDFHSRVSQEYQKGNSASRIMKNLKLNENTYIRLFSHGQLSMMNMVRSSIRDYENSKNS